MEKKEGTEEALFRYHKGTRNGSTVTSETTSSLQVVPHDALKSETPEKDETKMTKEIIRKICHGTPTDTRLYLKPLGSENIQTFKTICTFLQMSDFQSLPIILFNRDGTVQQANLE